MTEHNPAPSPSGHPLLSAPPTLTDIHQIFTSLTRPCGALNRANVNKRKMAADNTESAAKGEVSGAYEVCVGGRLRPRPNRAHGWGCWATVIVCTGQAAISGAAQPG